MTMHALKADIPQPLAARLAELAETMQRSTDSVVSEALMEWINREDRERRLIEEGQADIDAGRIVDHEEILAWAESLATASPLPVPHPRR